MNMNAKAHNRFGWILVLAVALVLAALALTGCGSLKRTAYVGGGSALGAAAGSLLGPAGAIGGAGVGGAVTSAVVEADAKQDRVDVLEERMYPMPYEPPPAPWWDLGMPWWSWLIALWIWLRRAHLLDALTGKEPRLDAILRALGIRTHKTPARAKGTA